jgi:NAD+ kinase
MPKILGIVANRRKPDVPDLIEGLRSWLEARSVQVLVWDDLCGTVPDADFTPIDEIAERSDVVVALGGDGTLLRAARAVGDRTTPILGVNIGSLGFLTEVTASEVYRALEAIISGDYRYEDRMNVDAVVVREGKEVSRFTALNDMVINKGALSRVIGMKTVIDREYLATYTADGLIVSTPTGSTAYSLSAGGPIVNPSMDAIIATPICPHTLAIRPVILAPAQRLSVELSTGVSLDGEPEVKLTVDGQVGFDLASGDTVVFSTSQRRTRLVLSGDRSFYEVLRDKLRWGDIRRRL